MLSALRLPSTTSYLGRALGKAMRYRRVDDRFRRIQARNYKSS